MLEQVIVLCGDSGAGKTPTLNKLIQELDASISFRTIEIVHYDDTPVLSSQIDEDKKSVFLHLQSNRVVCICTKGDGSSEIADNIAYFEQMHIDRLTGTRLLVNTAISASHRNHVTKNMLDAFAAEHNLHLLEIEKKSIPDESAAKRDSLGIISQILNLLV